MPQVQDRPKVYRLQGLPDRPDFDRLAATQFLASVINDPNLTADDIQIYSLATTVDPHKKWDRMVATVIFKRTPIALAASDETNNTIASQWRFHVPGRAEPLVLDTHFLGLTVLNDVSVAEHRFDCIVMSGLASHPFGSWQPKGDDKSYMWIRDTLPTSIDGARFILYGYDTTLENSYSFQTIVDLANSLYLTLQTNGWESPSTKPLVFLAHSLGGVLLKQLIVLLAGANDSTRFMLNMIKGAIFFGTPSRGMALGQLLTLVGGQPNKDLVEHLSETSHFLPNLETRFAGVSHLQRMRLFWAYETKTSPTVQKVDGAYRRSGPRTIMVDQQSATGNHTLDPAYTIQIDEDHSEMVKFKLGDPRIPIIISRIQEMCRSGEAPLGLDLNETLFGVTSDVQYANDSSCGELDLLEDVHKSELIGVDHDLMISHLKMPERDQRYQQIDLSFGNTFSWAFESRSIGLSKWLREGEGIFWINGKPGSGKSTLMKFLLNHKRTKELLNHWRSKPDRIIASFFFHHRGTHLQKSFEGLLASLLSQLVEGDSRLGRIVGDFLDEKSAYLYKTVQSDVNSFFQLCRIKSDKVEHRKRLFSLLSENPLLKADRLLRENLPEMKSGQRVLIRKTLLRDFDSLFRDIENKKASSNPIPDSFYYAKAKENTCGKLAIHFGSQSLGGIEPIIRSSYESLDVSNQIRSFLSESRLSVLNFEDEQHIAKLVERHKTHQKRQITFQLMQWTQSDLEGGLRRILNQEVFEIEVCLFFDALDEYAGSPDVISAFLQDLVKVVPWSKTRIRILFSSRPWTIFHDHFDTCPSISIHEHTMEDIREYCAGTLPQSGRTRALIRPFVSEIANRARGVFVWVKLVITDLVTLAAKSDHTDDQLSQMLRHCLDSLPNELEDYYSTIIHRLPVSTRRQSYILLECLSRSSDPISLLEVPSLLACGMSDSLHEAQTLIESKSAPGRTNTEGYLKNILGGLVEIIVSHTTSQYTSPQKESKLQFMHQTVKDWVELPTFKHTILGTRADMTWENGHSFLVKFHTYQNQSMEEIPKVASSRFFYHAVEAEMTTGVSQYAYLSRLSGAARGRLMSQNIFFSIAAKEPAEDQGHCQASNTRIDNELLGDSGDIDRGSSREVSNNSQGPGDRIQPPGGMKSPDKKQVPEDLTVSGPYLAAFGGLSLYLVDSVRHDELVFQRTFEPLVFLLLETVRYKSAVHQAEIVPVRLETAKIMLRNGARTGTHPNTLTLIFEGIWRSPDLKTASMYKDLVLTAAQNHCLSLNVRFGSPLDRGNLTSLLHLSPPQVAAYLLEQGADPNMLNAKGQTPLDYILQQDSVFQDCALGLDSLYDVVELLVTNGARRRQGTKHSRRLQDQELLKRLSESGYDTDPLLALLEQSLVANEEGMPPLVHVNEMMGQRTVCKRFSRMFRKFGVSSKHR